MTVSPPRRLLWHPLTATALVAAVAVGGAAAHVAARYLSAAPPAAQVAVAAALCWLAAGAIAGFATSGST